MEKVLQSSQSSDEIHPWTVEGRWFALNKYRDKAKLCNWLQVVEWKCGDVGYCLNSGSIVIEPRWDFWIVIFACAGWSDGRCNNLLLLCRPFRTAWCWQLQTMTFLRNIKVAANLIPREEQRDDFMFDSTTTLGKYKHNCSLYFFTIDCIPVTSPPSCSSMVCHG